jgi:thiol-disulfide isomerase/thioredoxin
MNSVLAAFILMQTVVDMTASPSPVLPVMNAAHPQARPFDAKAIADIDVSSALIRAALANKRVIIVMGANWCHDSIGLAGWFATPRFAAMLSSKYEVVYVDVGVPQTGNGRNSDIAKRFKAKPVKGTPTVFILSPQGKLLNKKDAGSWRNAASRSEDDIYRYFAELP